MNDQEALLKPKDVATWLGVHINTVKRMSDRGEIPFYRIGTRGDRRYRPVDIIRYLQGREDHGSGPKRGDARDVGESGLASQR